MSLAIETFNLSKSFKHTPNLKDFIFHPFKRREEVALQEVNLKVKRGELFTIIGRNGAGKTTLIKLLSTLILPDSGEALVNGYDLIEEEEKIKESIGLVSSEERSFYWRLSAKQNLQFFASLYNIQDQEAEERTHEVLEIVDLEDQADNRFDTFSTGMKNRLAIARGLINDPDIIFFDEPTKSMDPYHAQRLREFILDEIIQKQKKTVFLATHNLSEAEILSDRIAIIDEGQIKACGKPGELKKNINKKETYYISFKNGPQYILDYIKKTKGIGDIGFSREANIYHLELQLSQGDNIISQVMGKIVNAGGEVIECRKEDTSLDEIFNYYQVED